MTWTSPKDLKAQLMRLWERGELQRDAVTGHARFPLRLALKAPDSADITDRFEAVRAWDWVSVALLRIELQEVRHRVRGVQRLPAGAWIDSLADALSWPGKQREWERFSEQLSVTQDTHPALLPRLEKRPLATLAQADDWAKLQWAGLRHILTLTSTCAKSICLACTARSSKRVAACWLNCSISHCLRKPSTHRKRASVSSSPATASWTNRSAFVSGYSIPTSAQCPVPSARISPGTPIASAA